MTAPDELRRLAGRTLLAGFGGTAVPGWVPKALEEGLGGICLYGANVAQDAGPGGGLGQLVTQLRAVSPGLVVAVDEESGDVTRLHYAAGSPLPGAAALGRLDNPALTADCAAAVADELAATGITLNLAPVADVSSNPANPVIGTRSFGAEPSIVARHVEAWVNAQQARGVAACAKHFPGHGDTSTDSHLGLPTVTASGSVLRSRELPPFAAAIRAGVACVMTSHVVVPALDADVPATFSHAVVDGLLRRELGFAGVVVTDALDMAGAACPGGLPEAVVRAIAAGCDLVCLGAEPGEEGYAAVLDGVSSAVREGGLALGRLQEAAQRVAALAAAYRPQTVLPPQPSVRLPDLTGVLEVGPRVAAWCAEPGPWVLVQVESDANLAVGAVPWGLAAVVPPVSPDRVRPGVRVVVAARGVDDRHPALALAQGLRAAGHRTLVVEHGWPRGVDGVDVVTYGGSPVLAQALLELLGPPGGEPS